MSEQEAVNITEKKLILEIIQIYKDFPCLWDSSHELYCNKDARNQALEIILEKWKTGYPHATIEDVKKKIEHLRAAYRRERKKVGILHINNTLCQINILIIFSKYIQPWPKVLSTLQISLVHGKYERIPNLLLKYSFVGHLQRFKNNGPSRSWQ